MICYQYRADRARRTLRGIDEQVAKAAKAVAGLAPVKRNRFIALDGAVKSVNRELEARARDLAGIKGYRTNLAACPEKSFRMSKSDLRARPIYHRKRDSIEAHLTMQAFQAAAQDRRRTADRPPRGGPRAGIAPRGTGQTSTSAGRWQLPHGWR
jgi:hypothetical protein